jgi:hypothetical protein
MTSTKVGWECPECGKDSPYVNVGRTHVCYCTGCQVSWVWGSNLTDSWKYQTEAEQRAEYEAAGIDRMRRIEE